ncbi:SDR family NAD(P)-dependent oxidoreductase [Chlorogloeopsis fritschii PCC 9212]|uniref:Short-chain dehydrogenase n=1 Tax=Chlorogloeopsis fritschii PCC 6912 TaxID=211165 RepID=A0A433N2U8_CHLFR|nr:SDR family NAD(P)-dependent oxidoreductase [Chlorogloeopsis fritschii]MBF2006841.1 SDR family NAD(P)-dependent oxidoreductase [Chlorogloeopsis fritschii C42_A2020_084]RUR75502.1 short-chain dehydrogenase [Chlorogloeopsis fritschii PCC 6912]
MTAVLVIVGMGDGNGLAIAHRFAQEGFAIAMIARNQSKLQGYQDILQAQGFEAHYFIADAGDETAMKSAFAELREQLGNPEVLVYNAAVPRMENVLNESFEALLDDFKVNVAGALVAAKAVLPGMQAQGKGTILFTGGGFALYPSPDFASLSIGKSGIRSLANTLGAALKEQNIRVGTITICGTVNPADSKYNPNQIAQKYWEFYTAPNPEIEVIY